jgi:hypothetical protein
MKKGEQVGEVQIPETLQDTANWLRILAREVNTYVLFLQTWSAMGFLVSPELVASLLELQGKVLEARSQLSGEGRRVKDLKEVLLDIASREDQVFRKMMEEIKKFKEETEDVFPALKLNFDPCF